MEIKINEKITNTLIYLFLLIMIFGRYIEKIFEKQDFYEFLKEHSINKKKIQQSYVYPSNWVCRHISSFFMEKHQDIWRVMAIKSSFFRRTDSFHIVNYRFEGERLIVHDEFWAIEYEIPDWRNMDILLNDWGVPWRTEQILKNIIFIPNVRYFDTST